MKLTPRKKEILQQLHLCDNESILCCFPIRYNSITFLEYKDWQYDSTVIFEGKIISKIKLSRFKGNQSVVRFDVETSQDVFHISCFNHIWLMKNSIGDAITIYGKYQNNNKVLALQTYSQPVSSLLGIYPVYSLKNLMKDKDFNRIVNMALAEEKDTPDWMPEHLKEKYGFPSRLNAIDTIHNPKDKAKLLQALQRMKYEEFLLFNLQLLKRRQENRTVDESCAKNIDRNSVNAFIDKLPFLLTDDQKCVIEQILKDMENPAPMFRLLQGDVGSGKTIVSFAAMVACVSYGAQALMMAPTEILAKQHYHNLVQLTGPKHVELLIGSLSTLQRDETLKRIENGEADFIIGTHALFQDGVKFKSLGLIVTDEQQRFGVNQRRALMKKGDRADVLMMSATPIPRTLANTLYGDMDISTIEHTPNVNKSIITKLIRKNSFIPVIDEIESLLDKGMQMYVICPAIESGSVTRNVTDICNNLRTYFKGRYSVDLLHGQLSAQQKEEVEERFKNGQTRILVSTTVVEVGVDVPNANIMVIYDANRFGLSQIHQLRGRVGRGKETGYCYLLTSDVSEEAINKLQFMENNTDGFKIAQYDLKMRGPGDLVGTRQSGLPVFVLGNIINDAKLLAFSRDDAQNIIEHLCDYPLVEHRLVKSETFEE